MKAYHKNDDAENLLTFHSFILVSSTLELLVFHALIGNGKKRKEKCVQIVCDVDFFPSLLHLSLDAAFWLGMECWLGLLS